MQYNQMKYGLEQQLLTNALPYPQHYDGKKWNTVVGFRRKSLPTYLRKDMPTTRYDRIKEKFRQMDKMGPPKIQFFQKLILPVKKEKKRMRHYRNKITQQKIIEQSLTQMRQEMQYALVMADPQSNTLVNLLEKVSKTERDINRMKGQTNSQSFGRRLVSSKASRSAKMGESVERCFGGTVDLVFRLKKKECEQNSRIKSMVVIPNKTIEQKVKSIRLKTFSENDKNARNTIC